MSDYIKKQDVIDIIHKEIKSTESYIEHNTQINIKFAVEELPTLDEKEIIRKPMERILKRLGQKEELEVVAGEKGSLEDARLDGYVKGIKKAIEVVKKEGGVE